MIKLSPSGEEHRPWSTQGSDPGLEGRLPLIYISLRQPVRDLHVCDLFTLTWSSVRIICMKCLCIYMSAGWREVNLCPIVGIDFVEDFHKSKFVLNRITDWSYKLLVDS